MGAEQPPRRVVLHAGFHKTGTTTVQTLLRRNGGKIAPFMVTAQNSDLRDFIQSCRSQSMWHDPLSAEELQARLEAFVAAIVWVNRQVLLISVEEMSGLLPGLPQRRGRPDVTGYDAAPTLIRLIVAALRRALGPLQIDLIYGTRAPQAWISSVYWQHVKVQRMVMEHAEFIARYSAAADLGAVVDRVAQANPDINVHRFALEDMRDTRLGPAKPILDLCGMPDDLQARLVMPPAINVAPPPDMLAEMLMLNRSSLGADALKARKQAMEAELRQARAL